MLPKTSKLTFIDKYVYSSFLLDLLILFQVTVLQLRHIFFDSQTWARIVQKDNLLLKCLVLVNFMVFLLLHFFFFWLSVSSLGREKAKIGPFLHPKPGSYDRSECGGSGWE